VGIIENERAADVIVVGGGISGLCAAYRLTQSTDLSVLVLEANDRVGGRTVNLPLPGGGGKVVEGGGQWIGPGQDRVKALAGELGVGTFNTYVEGESVYIYQGKRQTYSGAVPPASDAALADYAQAQTQLEQMASTVSLDAPWQAANAEQWDAMTFGQWLDANMSTAEAKRLFALAFSITNSQDPHSTSLLFVLFAIHSWGGIDSMFSTSGGAQESRFIGGSQEISLEMARRLGSRVLLQTPVDHVDQTSESQVLLRSGAQEFRARRVIVAMTPQDANRIRFAPTLTTERIMLQKLWQVGTAWKTFSIYETPFWRDMGLNAQALTDIPAALFTADNSPPDGRPGVLVSFFATANQTAAFGSPSRQRNNKQARMDAVLDGLAQCFGEQARHPIAYLEQDWLREPYIAGCESPRPPGLLTLSPSAVVDPIDRIHWAGTETSAIWDGYMDGAVRAGERAAVEVVASLDGTPDVAAGSTLR
jgi:monoamine oxidase